MDYQGAVEFGLSGCLRVWTIKEPSSLDYQGAFEFGLSGSLRVWTNGEPSSLDYQGAVEFGLSGSLRVWSLPSAYDYIFIFLLSWTSMEHYLLPYLG